jgi:hypothetical protein
MYEMSQRHPVWVAENHIKPCNIAASWAESTIKKVSISGLLDSLVTSLNCSLFCWLAETTKIPLTRLREEGAANLADLYSVVPVLQ